MVEAWGYSNLTGYWVRLARQSGGSFEIRNLTRDEVASMSEVFQKMMAINI